MAAKTLQFYPRGTACVPDPHGAEASPQRRRIVGRKHEQVEPGVWGWVPTGKPDALPPHNDLIKAVKDGDLWPADEETAKACGVKFDPDFGGEVKAAKASAEKAAKEAAEKAKAEAASNKSDAGSTGGKESV